MRTHHFFGALAPLFVLALSCSAPTARAQMLPTMPSPVMPSGEETTQTTAVTRTVPPLAAGGRNGSALLNQLTAVPFRPVPVRKPRTARGRAAYSRRVARMSPTARKKLVLQKYRIPPRGWLAAYLPADRYKFGKVWQYVSTETDRFYYRPQDMARRGFNANRVIGFRTWQDAMLAGYRPDPISKPEPGRQFAYLARLTRDQPLLTYLEYAYAGQVSPASLDATFNYIRRVKAVIDRNPRVRRYQRSTINRILEASLTGDTSLIPRQLGVVPRVQITAEQPGMEPGMEPDATQQPTGAP